MRETLTFICIPSPWLKEILKFDILKSPKMSETHWRKYWIFISESTKNKRNSLIFLGNSFILFEESFEWAKHIDFSLNSFIILNFDPRKRPEWKSNFISLSKCFFPWKMKVPYPSTQYCYRILESYQLTSQLSQNFWELKKSACRSITR